MPRLLHIQSSPNYDNSATRRLSDKFVATWVANHANIEVDVLDLAADPLPHFGPEIMDAFAAPAAERTPQMLKTIALSDRLIEQIEAANIIVIGAPMVNFTICTQLKAWFDYLSVAGKTFKFVAPGIARGLLFGKKAFVISSRGGAKGDTPTNAYEFHEPLLRMLLGFMGVFDVSFVRADGLPQKVDEASEAMQRPESVIALLTS